MPVRVRPVAWYRQTVRILDTGNDDVRIVRFLDKALRGTVVHWKNKTTIPCQFENCKTGVHDSLTCWKGYCPGEWWLPVEREWIPVVICGTSNLELSLRGRDLRGQVWRLFRDGHGKKNLPMLGTFLEQSPAEQCGPWFDMELVLANAFHPFPFVLDIENPAKAKIVLPANPAPPPACVAQPATGKNRLTGEGETAEEVYKRLGIPLSPQPERKVNGHSREGAPNAPVK